MTEENFFEVCKKATGSPVKVVMLADSNATLNASQDDLISGARAAVKTINEKLGGVGCGGHPIELEVFETDIDPVRTKELAEYAAASSCVAMVGNLIMSYPTSAILEKVGLASVPAVPCVKDEYYSPFVFNANGGHIAMDGGKIDIAFHAGAKKPGSLTSDIPGIPWFADVHNLTLKRYGLPEETVLHAAPYCVDDITPWVERASKVSDAIMLTLINNQDTVNSIFARSKLGLTLPIIVEGMALTPEDIAVLGRAGDGLLVASLFPPSDNEAFGQRCYIQSMTDAGYEKYLGDKSQMSWMAFDLFHYALRDVENITRKSVLAALRNVSDYTGGGITPVLNFTEAAGPGAGYPRLYNWTYYPAKLQDSKIVSIAEDKGWACLPFDIPKSDAEWETPAEDDNDGNDATGGEAGSVNASAGIIGTWDTTLVTPMGEMNIVIKFAETKDGVSGEAVFEGDTIPLAKLNVTAGKGGTEQASWEAYVKKPLKMNIRFIVTASGSVLDGYANAGIFLRKAAVKGVRR
jgi:ABC-type branched-subunit amino acid transport system substrate-binding protein